MTDIARDVSPTSCPNCGAKLAQDAGFCESCGLNVQRELHSDCQGSAGLPPRDSDDYDPYQPPSPTPHDSDDASHPSLFWRNGRMSRRGWWGVQLGTMLVLHVAASAIEAVTLPRWLIVPLHIPALWLVITSQIERWHDINRSGY